MLIKVERYKSTDVATLSRIYIDGEFQCYGLEDEYRAEKVSAQTRIPPGEYKVTLRTEGGFHSRYAVQFGSIHYGMLWVRDVPGFEYILIHIGNDHEDTAGCLLVGRTVDEDAMFIGHSRDAYKSLYLKVCDDALDGNLRIEYVDTPELCNAERERGVRTE